MSTTTKKQYDVLSPWKLAYVVLRTARFDEIVDFYKRFLRAGIEFENERAYLLRYDDEHHRIGIIKFNNLSNNSGLGLVLEYIAFTFRNLADLVTAFRENPVGTNFNPEELKRRVQSGEDHTAIKRRVEIGPRAFPTMVGVRLWKKKERKREGGNGLQQATY
ncbi:uncharacterized protein Z520_05106 [Fonsecaea multimorphosa CBS 102226]|uniref:VOC domain-containing protein n=1 Tax=Fonsecaea multimorphosa CBS 102226 TaxID=1442371 RepID=A0A0D2HCA6_9EURO|nr:uncharacterized protein Z520_05106 [Fonsecaea multimorphosa CBS 102226]KIX99530.1 hypothetical protein Z520_05106 [Fonsecaea multimorphosa CBS 102226]